MLTMTASLASGNQEVDSPLLHRLGGKKACGRLRKKHSTHAWLFAYRAAQSSRAFGTAQKLAVARPRPASLWEAGRGSLLLCRVGLYCLLRYCSSHLEIFTSANFAW
jgi:hypothetical protein